MPKQRERRKRRRLRKRGGRIRRDNLKDTHIKGIETFVTLLFAAAAFTYASTSRYRYRYWAECTRLFNGCCLLQTIKAAFPPLPGPPVMPVYGCVYVCVCVTVARCCYSSCCCCCCWAAVHSRRQKRTKERRALLPSRRVSSLCPCVLDVLGWLCLGPWALFKQTTLTVFVVVILAQLLLLL